MHGSARQFAFLSLAAAVATIVLKTAAWWFTGSIGLLSDALEGAVNLVGAVILLFTLTIAARPPDDEHAYGYSKVEYFASGIEGLLILVAAVAIIITAAQRLLAPLPLQHIAIGLGVSAVAALINYVVARKLFTAGDHHKSIALEADAQHLMTDVWTSIGVIVGVAAAAVTGWYVLDPLIAIAVALHIGWVGSTLIGRSARGLLDQALPAAGRAALEAILLRYRADGIDFHAVRTRQAGARVFVALHVLVPDQWSVARGHELLEQIESDIRNALPGSHVFTHLEPLGSPDSYQDIELDR